MHIFNKIFIFLCFLYTFGKVNAWFMGFYSGSDYTGTSEEFHSKSAENGCYDLSTKWNKNLPDSMQWCTFRIIRCSVVLFNKPACKGDKLGHTNAGASWSKRQLSKNGKHVKSFKVQGCYLPPKVPFDTNSCK